jgi:hypothetical protein
MNQDNWDLARWRREYLTVMRTSALLGWALVTYFSWFGYAFDIVVPPLAIAGFLIIFTIVIYDDFYYRHNIARRLVEEAVA